MQASATTLTRNGLGARSIDYLSTTTSSGTAVSYPVYDAHGNMVSTLAKSGSGYAVSNRRAYDAWGGIRQGTTSGDPKRRYCARRGHVQDDESSLVYMQARYYEPGVGEDDAGDGTHWFVYGGNDPVNHVDRLGSATNDANVFQPWGRMGNALMIATPALAVCAKAAIAPAAKAQLLVQAAATMGLAVASYALALGLGSGSTFKGPAELIKTYRPFGSAILAMIPAFVTGLSEAWRAGFATMAVCPLSMQSATQMGELFAQEIESHG